MFCRQLQQDPTLDGVSLVILDEFYERSLQADLKLALLLDVQRGLARINLAEAMKRLLE